MSDLSPGELKRKLVHLGAGGFAFLLRELTWPQGAALALAAFLFNWQVLPRVGGRSLWRGDERERGYARGILLYPLSVLGLVLWLRDELWMAAAAWGVLAFGDGMASLLGLAAGGPRLPWNPRKGWIGLLAFVAFGTLGSGILAAWTLRLPLSAWAAPAILSLTLPLNLLCALVESLPTTLDDNLTVPLAAGVLLPLLAQAEPAALLSDPGLPRRALAGLAINAVVAAAAFRARSIDVPGALSAVLIGTAITAGLGLAAFALMAAFFVIGSAATKAGYAVKAARGIAQERGGARGWRNAWANGGVAAFLALLGGMAPPARELFALSFAAAVATAATDTCASEVGKAWGRRTFLLTTLRGVPPGTEGAVSLEGTLGGLLGGGAVAALGAALGLYGWAGTLVVVLAGQIGSFAESLIGGVAESRGWLGNDLLNAFNTALGAAAAWGLTRAFS